LIGTKEIGLMRKGSIIVNTARGPVIDEEAMILALQNGHVSRSEPNKCPSFLAYHL
jgi:phosphoglycerate dehydrogenase-like enzyme